MDEILRVLGELGVPAGILASIVMAIFLRTSFKRIAFAAAVVGIVGLVAYSVIELYPKGRDALWSPVSIKTKPDIFFAFRPDGMPIDLTISAFRGERLLVEEEFRPISEESLRDRTLSLQRLKNGYSVRSGKHLVGTLTDESAAAAGLIRRDGLPPIATDVFYVRRLYRGDEVKLRTELHEEVSLLFDRVESGGAVVTLQSPALASPKPPEVTVPNHGNDRQYFEAKHEFLIALLEANFTKPNEEWGTFVVVHID